MATLSIRDPEYVDFEKGVNTLRYRHAVSYSGQRLLHRVMISLCEDPTKIKETVREKLGSNTKFKNSFTKEEVKELDNLPHRKWNLSLVFKIIQKICGLRPEGDIHWTQVVSGAESLEYLVTKIKKWRNELAHNIYEVIPDDQLPARLDELENLGCKIISALKEALKQRSRAIPFAELNQTAEDVKDVVKEVKKMKVTIIRDNDSDSDMDDDIGNQINPGQTPCVESYEELFKVLLKDFWMLAGPQ